MPVSDHRIETHRVIRIIQGGDYPVVNSWTSQSSTASATTLSEVCK